MKWNGEREGGCGLARPLEFSSRLEAVQRLLDLLAVPLAPRRTSETAS